MQFGDFMIRFNSFAYCDGLILASETPQYSLDFPQLVSKNLMRHMSVSGPCLCLAVTFSCARLKAVLTLDYTRITSQKRADLET